jgi:hypothetical protein
MDWFGILGWDRGGDTVRAFGGFLSVYPMIERHQGVMKAKLFTLTSVSHRFACEFAVGREEMEINPELCHGHFYPLTRYFMQARYFMHSYRRD